jgi:hypothetical protein
MRKRTLVALACVASWLALSSRVAADEASPEPPVDFTSRLDSGGGTFTATGGPAETLVRVTGAHFQGSATFTFKSMTPSRLKFRFANVRALQSFTLSDGKHSYTGQFVGAGRTVTHWDKLGRNVTNPGLAAVTMTIEGNAAGDIDVSVSTPRDVELNKELKINWIQFLRVRKGFDD